ncbi:hypothetical protein KCP74_02360 [Salmonella enterica subsp. enterica]|nr:hypothetical protein KCP74_02360 [Salmonella enterica subsp. enterica]
MAYRDQPCMNWLHSRASALRQYDMDYCCGGKTDAGTRRRASRRVDMIIIEAQLAHY